MSSIQRGELSEGVRKRFRTSSDSSPDEVNDAFQPVVVVENDRPENMAILGTRMCCAVASAGAPGAGNFNFWCLFNPFGSGVLMTVEGFVHYTFAGISAGSAANSQMMVNLNFSDVTPVIGSKVADGNFMDTRLDLSAGGAQPLPAGQIFLSQGANIGGGAWRPMFRVPVQLNLGGVPANSHNWPGISFPSRRSAIVLAPNSAMLLQPQGTDYSNFVTQVDFFWTERLMGELEATFQQDSKHWTL